MADIVDIALQSGNFTTLVRALQEAGLVEALKGPGPFTVFAPTDDAFHELAPGTLDTLLGNKSLLQDVLKYHVIAGRVTSDDIKDKKIHQAQALNGEVLNIDTTMLGVTKVNTATITKADILADNGVVHVVNHVLLPGKMRGERAA